MQQMRLQLLTAEPGRVGVRQEDPATRVYGVVFEFVMGPTVITVSALHDGTASIYTTTDFGVIGGGQHAAVREKAKKLIAIAQPLYDSAAPTSEFAHPDARTAQFFLLGWEGVRLRTDSLSELGRGQGQERELWCAGQDLLTALRHASEGR